jgi:transposase
MARRRTRVSKIRQIITYSMTTHMSERQIARALSVSRTVVAKTLRAFAACGLPYEGIAELPDSRLLRALECGKPPETSPRYQQLAVRFPGMVTELKKKGVTLQWLWELYMQEHPEGYQYSQYCWHFHRWCKGEEVVMHIEHKAGEEMFVDWAGDKLEVINGNTGQPWQLEQFVAILGASELTYVEARENQQQDNWIRANEAALRYFQGVPSALIPDNTRTAVSAADLYEPGLNPVFEEFAQHYGLVIVPARVRKARDKALVENAVRLVYQRISARLRGKVFFSLCELNAAIRELLEKHNNRPLSRLKISRRQLFEQIEREALKPLRLEPFPMKNIAFATVQLNYHAELRQDRHFYSVPYYLRRREPATKVKIVYDERVVAIYWDNTRVAQHRRDRKPGGYTTLAEHMPPQHRWYAEWSPERFRRWARVVGPQTETLIGKVLDRRAYAPQAYRSCLGILNLVKHHGAVKLEKACAKALQLGSYSCKRIRNILTLRLEEESQPQLDLNPSLPVHENLRGSQYYN